MIVIIILLCIIFLIIAFAQDYYQHCSRSGRLIDQIPGPKTIPIIGNTLAFQVSYDKVWPIFRTLTDKYYPILKLWFFSYSFVSIRHPDDIEVILNNIKHIDKGPIYTALEPWLNTGLLTSTGAKWRSRRKILTPAFHFNILRQFVDILIEEGERMVQSLENIGGTVEKDVIAFTSEHTLNAICETAMGTSLHNLSVSQKYRERIQQIGQTIVYRLLSPWMYSDIIFALSPTGRLQKKIIQDLHEFTEKIIEKRKLDHKRTNGQNLQNVANDNVTRNEDVEIFKSIHSNCKRRLALLDLLIAVSQENYLSDVDIREEVDTFMFEGYDTTAMGITHILLLLAEHKDIQNRVREEVNTVMKQSEGKLTMTSLQNLTYLERCLKESLRLYPSVHFISRVTAEDVQLQSYVVPANTIVHLNIYGVHRDADFWPNPDIFDPDRFLPERIQNRHPYSYLPFSAGPRNCIGQRFAMLEMKAIIAPLIHNFYLEPVDYLKNMQIKADLVLRPKYPMHIKFVPIKVQ